MASDDIVPALEIHGNQAVIVPITVMLCYESEPTGVKQRKAKRLVMRRLAFFLVGFCQYLDGFVGVGFGEADTWVGLDEVRLLFGEHVRKVIEDGVVCYIMASG